MDEIMTMGLAGNDIAVCAKAPAEAVTDASAIPNRILQVILILSPAPQCFMNCFISTESCY
jgi:hypothetical protein